MEGHSERYFDRASCAVGSWGLAHVALQRQLGLLPQRRAGRAAHYSGRAISCPPKCTLAGRYPEWRVVDRRLSGLAVNTSIKVLTT